MCIRLYKNVNVMKSRRTLKDIKFSCLITELSTPLCGWIPVLWKHRSFENFHCILFRCDLYVNCDIKIINPLISLYDGELGRDIINIILQHYKKDSRTIRYQIHKKKQWKAFLKLPFLSGKLDNQIFL